MKLIIGGSEPNRTHDHSLITAVARSRHWADQLITGEAESLADLAKREGLSLGYVHQVLPLAFLSPKIVERILSGEHSTELSAEKLIRDTDRPVLWSGQIAALA